MKNIRNTSGECMDKKNIKNTYQKYKEIVVMAG